MELINRFAVVTYLDGRLAQFVEQLRGVLKPGDLARAHLTVLPPRPLKVPNREAITELREIAALHSPFEVCPGEVDAFEETRVVKLSIKEGQPKLLELYQALSEGPFQAQEDYKYVPHITLGLKISEMRFHKGLEEAQQRWAEFGAREPIPVRTLTLVQQAGNESWHDVGRVELGKTA